MVINNSFMVCYIHGYAAIEYQYPLAFTQAPCVVVSKNTACAGSGPASVSFVDGFCVNTVTSTSFYLGSFAGSTTYRSIIAIGY